MYFSLQSTLFGHLHGPAMYMAPQSTWRRNRVLDHRLTCKRPECFAWTQIICFQHDAIPHEIYCRAFRLILYLSQSR